MLAMHNLKLQHQVGIIMISHSGNMLYWTGSWTNSVTKITVTLLLFIICHKIQITIKQNSYTKANETGKEAQTMRLIDIGHPQSKSEVK